MLAHGRRRDGSRAGTPTAPWAGATYPDPRASVIWAPASAVAFGVFLTALPKASKDGRAWALFDARVALVALVGLWAGRRIGGLRATRDLPLMAVPGLLLVAGTLLYTRPRTTASSRWCRCSAPSSRW